MIDGGGQREIVEHGVSGFRFRALDEMCSWTLRLVGNTALRSSIQQQARRRSELFGRAAFETAGGRLFDLLRREYSTLPPGDLDELQRRFRVDSAPPRG